MSDQRRIVPSETPSACAACEVDRPSGLGWNLLHGSISATFAKGSRSSCSNCTTFRTEDHVVVGRNSDEKCGRMTPRCQRQVRRSWTMRLRLYHHPDGARVAYRETGTGPAARAPALARTLAPRVGADRRAAVGALPRRAARSAAARRLRGPPAPPLHAGLAGRRDRRVLPRGRRPAADGRRPRHRRRAGAAGRQHRPARAGAASC